MERIRATAYTYTHTHARARKHIQDKGDYVWKSTNLHIFLFHVSINVFECRHFIYFKEITLITHITNRENLKG